MREYRGKRIDGKGWAIGWYCETFGKHYIMPKTSESYPGVYMGGELSHEVDPATVGQYTGLNDHREDKRIFIGDSVRGLKRGTDDEWHRVEVYEHKGCTMFGNWNAHEFFNKFQYIEVMGSIHDNPELLDAEKG